MKIEYIELQNLNSLKGVHRLDLDSGPLADAGLFAVTGPTGSGKTTIFDAVCLSLYGQTPRLRKRDTSDKKTRPEEIVTRHTAEAYCECGFRINGTGYNSRWEVHRARHDLSGDFVPQSMVLSKKAETGEYIIIEDKLSRVPACVEEITGLSFERFMRSIMLAQGEFDAFLSISSKDRAELLEKLTGTSIYSQLSKEAFRRFREEQQLLNEIINKRDSLILLSEEEKAELKAIVETVGHKSKNLDERLKQNRELLGLFEQSRETENELQELEKTFSSLRVREQEIKEKAESLNRAKSAEYFRTNLETYELQQKGIEKQTEKSNSLSDKVMTLEEEIKQSELQEKSLSIEIDRLKTEDADNQKIVAQARELELRCNHIEKEISEIAIELNAAGEEKEKISIEREKLVAAMEDSKAAISVFQQWKESVPFGEALLDNWPLVENKLQQKQLVNKSISEAEQQISLLEEEYKETQNYLQKSNLHIEDYTKSVNAYKKRKIALAEKSKQNADASTQLPVIDRILELQSQIHDLDENIFSIEKKSKENKVDLDRLKSQIDKLKHDLAKPETVTILGFILKRQLKKGKPCPVCGSTNHPSHSQNELDFGRGEETVDTKDVIRGFETLTNYENEYSLKAAGNEQNVRELKKLRLEKEKTAKSLKDQLKNSKWDEIPSVDELSTYRNQLIAIADASGETDEELKAIEQELEDTSKKLNDEEKKRSDLNTKLQTVKIQIDGTAKRILEEKEELNAFTVFLSQYGPIDEIFGNYSRGIELAEKAKEGKAILDNLEKESSTLDNSYNSICSKEQELKQKQNKQKETVTETKLELKKLIGDTDSDSFALNCKKQYDDKVQEYSGVKDRISTLAGKKSALITQISETSQMLEEMKELSAKQRVQMEKDIAEKGFRSLNEVQNALLSLSDQENMTQEIESYNRDSDRLQQQQNTAEKRLKNLQNRLKDVSSEEEIKEETDKLSNERDTLLSRSGSAEEKLKRDDELIEQQKQLNIQIEQQKKEYEIWNLMNSLIGSSDGRAFQRFAQSVTLDRLVENANRHLISLSSRYVLGRRDEENLSLEITDTWQGNLIRPVTTLSGGETFVVSLSLALGLSGLVSNRLNIETLFLDEGFGTLDSETLETVLSVLETFRSQGKQIGVISHVEALKERIRVKVDVLPVGNGHSRIEVREY